MRPEVEPIIMGDTGCHSMMPLASDRDGSVADADQARWDRDQTAQSPWAHDAKEQIPYIAKNTRQRYTLAPGPARHGGPRTCPICPVTTEMGTVYAYQHDADQDGAAA
ncbi:MAG: hypothetical protein ACLTHL_00190 [Collinsella sp.]